MLDQIKKYNPKEFAFYGYDFEMEFIRHSNIPVEMQDLDLFVLFLC